MFRMTNLAVPIALAIGAACGWAAASGRLDSLLKAESNSAAETVNVACPLGVCCNSPDKAAALAALAAHNQKVSANLRQEGKKPNILVIWGDDIGWFNPSCYHSGDHGLPDARTSTASPEKGRGSPTGTGSRAAPPAGPRSSPASRRSAPG